MLGISIPHCPRGSLDLGVKFHSAPALPYASDTSQIARILITQEKLLLHQAAAVKLKKKNSGLKVLIN